MPSSIDPEAQAQRRREAWQSAVTATVLRLAAAALLLFLRRYHHMEDGLIGTLMLLIALLDLGTIVPVWILLKTRLKEIEGGEEDAASQY